MMSLYSINVYIIGTKVWWRDQQKLILIGGIALAILVITVILCIIIICICRRMRAKSKCKCCYIFSYNLIYFADKVF